MNKRTREPLFHITKRAALPWWAVWAIRGGALLAALIVCGVITSLVTGENPFQVMEILHRLPQLQSRKGGVVEEIRENVGQNDSHESDAGKGDHPGNSAAQQIQIVPVLHGKDQKALNQQIYRKGKKRRQRRHGVRIGRLARNIQKGNHAAGKEKQN